MWGCLFGFFPEKLKSVNIEVNDAVARILWLLWHVPFLVASFWWESSDSFWAILKLALSKHTFFFSTIWYHTSVWRLRGRSCHEKKLPVANFPSRDLWKNFLPVCICLLKSLLKCLSVVKQNQEHDTDVRLLLPHRSCCSHGGNLNVGCWHTVLESDKRDCVH